MDTDLHWSKAAAKCASLPLKENSSATCPECLQTKVSSPDCTGEMQHKLAQAHPVLISSLTLHTCLGLCPLGNNLVAVSREGLFGRHALLIVSISDNKSLPVAYLDDVPCHDAFVQVNCKLCWVPSRSLTSVVLWACADDVYKLV